MAHYLAELYTPKPAWLDLSETERQQFFAGIGSAVPLYAITWTDRTNLREVCRSACAVAA